MRSIRQVFSELIGRQTKRIYAAAWRFRRPYRATTDQTRADYEFFDRLRWCMNEGLTVSALLVKPIISKISAWTLGRAPYWSMDHEASQERFNEWWHENHADIAFADEEARHLGDYFIVVNPDATITLLHPDVVEPIVNPDDYGQIIGWRIVERKDHPTEVGKWMIEINEYYADRRIMRREFDDRRESEQVFRNLLGMVPVVHVVGNRVGNQPFGQPELYALVSTSEGALYRYDDILHTSINGNMMNGRQTPVINFPDVKALNDFWDRYAERVVDEETGEESYSVEFDSDKLLLMVGEFKYANPGSSAADAKTLLELLYWLFVEHAEIPDIMLGTEMGQSRSSGEVQIEPFVRFIEKKQMQAEKWLVPLADLVARMLALIEPGFRYTGQPKPRFETLTNEDNTLRFQVVQWAYTEGLIDKAWALKLAPIDIENVEELLEAAEEEQSEREDEKQNEVDFDAALREAIAQRNGAADEDEDIPVDEKKAA